MLNILICHLLTGAALAFDRRIGPLLAASAITFIEAVALSAGRGYGIAGGCVFCAVLLTLLQGGFVLGLLSQVEPTDDPI